MHTQRAHFNTSPSVRVAIIRGNEIQDDRRETVIKKATGKSVNDG
jgi:hypothetical protein